MPATIANLDFVSHCISRCCADIREKNGPGRAHGGYKFPLYWSRTLLMTIKGEKTMNRLSLIRYTSAVALGLSTLWSAAVCAAEDAGRSTDPADPRRRPEYWLRGYRPTRRPAGDPAARLALRHSELCPGGAGSSAKKGYRVIVPYLRGYGTTVSSPPARRVTVSRRRWRPILSI